jgi:hypothetical protein
MTERLHSEIASLVRRAVVSPRPLYIVAERCAELKQTPGWTAAQADTVGDTVVRMLATMWHLRPAIVDERAL